jgi:hypothetical protein
VVLLAGAAVAVVVAVRFVWDLAQPGPRLLAPIHAPRAYEVDYRVVFTNGNVVNDEQQIVERPYHSLDITRRDGKLVTGSITNDDGLFFYQEGKGWAAISPGKQPANDDPQPFPALQLGIRHHQAKILRTETVAGRTCTLVRTGSPLGEELKKPTSRNHTDVCLDRAGIILRYAWTLDGKLAQTMRATKVDLQPTITTGADGTFAATPRSSDQPPVQAGPLSDANRKTLKPSFHPPAGLRFQSAWVHVQEGTQPTITSTLLYLRGATDLVQLEYGVTQTTPKGGTVRLRSGRTGHLSLHLERSSLIVPTDGGSTVVISGTDPDLLIEVARGLVF